LTNVSLQPSPDTSTTARATLASGCASGKAVPNSAPRQSGSAIQAALHRASAMMPVLKLARAHGDAGPLTSAHHRTHQYTATTLGSTAPL
jgi:hypothetical protein